MAQTDARSLDEIRRDTERTRAGLTSTVDELRASVVETASEVRERLSPEAIKSEIGGYVRNRRDRLVEAAKENPLQAIAVGMSVAYPMLRVVRAIPVPVLLAGAGLFLASSKTGRDFTSKAGDLASDFADRAVRTAGDLQESAESMLHSATGTVTERLGTLREAAAEKVGVAADALQSAQTRAGAQMDRMAETAGDVRSRAGAMADEIQARVADKASSARQSAREAREGVASSVEAARQAALSGRDHAAELASQARRRVMDGAQRNPLLVAGLGILAGGLIAAALPRSDAERALAGSASRRIRRGAQSAARYGIERAHDAADSALDRMQQRAEQEGLTGEQFDESARDLAQRVRKVAEAAVTTAFELPQENHGQQDNTGGRRDG